MKNRKIIRVWILGLIGVLSFGVRGYGDMTESSPIESYQHQENSLKTHAFYLYDLGTVGKIDTLSEAQMKNNVTREGMNEWLTAVRSENAELQNMLPNILSNFNSPAIQASKEEFLNKLYRYLDRSMNRFFIMVRDDLPEPFDLVKNAFLTQVDNNLKNLNLSQYPHLESASGEISGLINDARNQIGKLVRAKYRIYTRLATSATPNTQDVEEVNEVIRNYPQIETMIIAKYNQLVSNYNLAIRQPLQQQATASTTTQSVNLQSKWDPQQVRMRYFINNVEVSQQQYNAKKAEISRGLGGMQNVGGTTNTGTQIPSGSTVQGSSWGSSWNSNQGKTYYWNGQSVSEEVYNQKLQELENAKKSWWPW